MEEKNLLDIQHCLWAVEQDILDEIHRVCTKNGLRYSLAYGTLLGAVRHGGFIPWDDDIDVMMPREDYERFLKIWNSASKPGYILQTEAETEDYNNNFAKIRKDKTTFLMYEEQRKRRFHKGIYVDIFPADRKAPSGFTSKFQYVAFALNLLFNRGYTSGTGGGIGLAEFILLHSVPKKFHHKVSLLAGKRSRRWNQDKTAERILPCTIRDCKRFYPSDLFDHFTELDFNGKKYHSVRDFESFLSIRYGDYMQLPPEEERVWKHHPILISFDHNIEDLD